MERKSSQFSIRGFSAIILAVATLGLPVTGVANHVYGFSGLDVTRHAWMAAHNALGTLFMIAAALHLVLNRRALIAHMRKVSADIFRMRREALWACGATALLLLVAVGHAFHCRV